MNKIKRIIKNKFLSFEDPNEPFLGPNIKILNFSGLLSDNNKLAHFQLIMLNLLMISQLIDVYQLTTNEETDINLLLTNLRFTCVTFVTNLKCDTFVKWRRKWMDILNYITESDLEERCENNSFRNKIIKSYTKYSRILTYAYCVMMITTAGCAASIPIINMIFTTGYWNNVKSGQIDFPHAVSVWVPFDKNNSPGCWILFTWHVSTAFYAAIVIATYDANMLVIMKFFEKKLELIQYTCTFLYKTSEGEICDELFYSRIYKCHAQHNDYKKHMKLFNSMLSPVMFIYVLVCSMFICTSAFQLTIEMNTFEKVMQVEFLLFAIVQLYVYCLHSNNVYYKSLEVSYGPYCCDWWLLDVRRRRMVLLLSGKLRKTVVFTAGPFTDLKMSTLTAILKGAYSYYTLLRE